MIQSADDRTLSTTDRRRFLTVLGALGVTGLAGCGGDGDDTDTPTDTEAGGNGNGERTPTDTEMGGNGEMTPTDTETGGNGETPTETDTPEDTPTDTPEQSLGENPAALLNIKGGSIQAGSTRTFSGTLENIYLFAIQNVEVSMTAPNDDWTVEATSDTQFDTMASGDTEDVGWEVTAPESADGEFTIEGSVSYETTTDSADLSPTISVVVFTPGDAPQDGLQAYFPLEADPPIDGSGNLNDPTNNGATFDSTGGVDGGAYDFDGTDDYLTYPDAEITYDGSADWTTTAWINPDSLPTDAGDGSPDYIWHPRAKGDFHVKIEGSNSEIGVSTYDGSVNFLSSGVTPPTGEWTHVAVVFDTSASDQYEVFVDGTSEATGNLPTPNSPSGLNLIAGQVFDGTERFYFDGRIDEVRLYDRALSASEIASLSG